MRRYTISWIHKLPSRWMIQNDSMAISSVKYWNNLKLKQYNKLRLKGAIGTKEIYVNSQASHRFFWHDGLCTWAYSKKIKLSNVWWLLTHKGTSTKSCVLCRDKKGSKRKLYMGYVYSDTFWAFNTKICFKKARAYPYLHWQIQIFQYMEDLLIQTLIFLSPAGFSLTWK